MKRVLKITSHKARWEPWIPNWSF